MTATANADAVAAPARLPTVLAILVARDAQEWLRECLTALAGQTYPRLAVLAVDDASADGSHELLVQALGAQRVIRHEQRRGLAGSVAAALALPVAAQADHVLLLHDDVALDPDAVARLVEATMIPGVEHVGVVGPKVVDWDRPRVLRDIGRSADRFGHPFTSLQPDELDQGQFDRVLEVLAVGSCAMLVSREVWQQLGLLDERLGDDDADLDLCWRVRVAGWRVLMTPLARARHRAVAELISATRDTSGRRYEEDRAALASMLKNYSWWSLCKVVPVAMLLAAVRLVYLTLARRFEEGFDLVRAWWWNVAHLPGTWTRRRRVQRARRIRDAAMRRFTESAGLRLPRWFQTAERILEEQRAIDDDDETESSLRLRDRTASLVGAHPVLVASVLGLVLGAVVTRELLGPEPLVGGALPAFPTSAGGFFTELVASARSTALGGSLVASPALAVLGALSSVTFGSAAIAQKVLVAAGPALAAIMLYRAAVRRTALPGPSAVAAAAYGLSAVVLWTYSEGRLGVAAALVAAPPLLERIEAAFGAGEPLDGRWRLAAGLALTLAVAVGFWPGMVLVFGVAVVVQLLTGRARVRGLLVAGAALTGAAILLFPYVPTLAAGGGAALTSTIGTIDPSSLVRLALGGGPGTWDLAAFLPIGAVLSLAIVRGPLRGPAWRAASLAVAGLGLAWCSAAGWLPAPLANAPGYTVMTAVAEALLIAYGVAALTGGLGREAFGVRQVGGVALAVVLTVGLVLQSVAVMTGRWAIGGPERIPAAWAVVDGSARGAFRVLWVGEPSGDPFPPPGGDPIGVVASGEASLRFGITDRDGVSALDLGRPVTGPGADALADALGEIVAGGTVHGGALLAPFGVRFVVARDDEVPPEALVRFERQVDLDVIPAAGLLILRNAAALPTAAVFDADAGLGELIDGADPSTVQRVRPARGVPLRRAPGGWDGPAGAGDLVFLSTEYDAAWQVQGSATQVRPAFGWATAGDADDGSEIRIRHDAQLPRTISIVLLAALWAIALWVTRRPVAR